MGITKRAWRAWAREVRAGLDIPALSAEITAHLLNWPTFRAAEHVLIYLAFGSEVSLEGLLGEGKRFYATRTAQGGLTVHRLEGALEPHPYGYLQPGGGSEEVSPDTLDLALVPGLAFDHAGNRLGYGKGYYDRLLPKLRAGTPLVGVAPEALIVEMLPCEAHDVRMTHLVSERGVRAV